MHTSQLCTWPPGPSLMFSLLFIPQIWTTCVSMQTFIVQMPVNLHPFLFQSWPLASERHRSRSPLRASPPGPPSGYGLPLQVVHEEYITTSRVCRIWAEPVRHTFQQLFSSFWLKVNVLFSSTPSISVPADSFEFQCIPIAAVTYKGLKSKWAGTVKDRVWEKEGEEGRTMFIKHGVGSRSHLSL